MEITKITKANTTKIVITVSDKEAVVNDKNTTLTYNLYALRALFNSIVEKSGLTPDQIIYIISDDK